MRELYDEIVATLDPGSDVVSVSESKVSVAESSVAESSGQIVPKPTQMATANNPAKKLKMSKGFKLALDG